MLYNGAEQGGKDGPDGAVILVLTITVVTLWPFLLTIMLSKGPSETNRKTAVSFKGEMSPSRASIEIDSSSDNSTG